MLRGKIWIANPLLAHRGVGGKFQLHKVKEHLVLF
ncbi:Uncharacterised protein [Yersinia enterocolitica]|nr:Uncharacterised protein [Yersinia enterocolitica]